MNDKNTTGSDAVDLDKLEALAKAATPGPWERGDGKLNGNDLMVYGEDYAGSAIVEMRSDANFTPRERRIQNLDFIAAANPATVLSLIAQARAAVPAATEKLIREKIATIKAHQVVLAERDAEIAELRAAPLTDARIDGYKLGSWFEARTVDEMQAFYLSRLPAIREAAKAHGYAIGLHGSTRRDFDLMAMQWREDASDKDSLARAIADAACGIRREGAYDWERKPSGRFAVSIPMCWTAHDNPDFDKPSVGHIDLSVIEAGSAASAGDATPARPAGEYWYEYRARHENGALLDWSPLDVDTDAEADRYLNFGAMGEWRRTSVHPDRAAMAATKEKKQ